MNLKRLLVVVTCLTLITLVPTTWAQDSETGDVEEVKVDETAATEEVLLNENEGVAAAAAGDYDTDAVDVTESDDDETPEPEAEVDTDTETTEVEKENGEAVIEEFVTDESAAKPKPPSSRSGNYYQYDDYMGHLDTNMGDSNYNYGEFIIYLRNLKIGWTN